MQDMIIEQAKGNYAIWIVAGLLMLTGCLVTVVVWLLHVLSDEDKTSKWRARMYKELFRFTGKREQEKKYISNDIRGRLNLARRAMHFGESVLPKAVDLEWVEGAEPTAYDIKEGQFVVRLDPSESQHKNIATLAKLLVQKTTLQGMRSWLDGGLQCAIDMTLLRKIIEQLKNREIFDWFISNEYQPAMQSNPSTELKGKQIRTIDERGLFIHMLLVELDEFGKNTYGVDPNDEMGKEILQLLQFVYALATKRPGQDVPLEMRETYFRIGVIWVAKTEKILKSGLEPYLDAMDYNIQRGAETVYVLIFDKDWLGQRYPLALEKFNKRIGDLQQQFLTKTMAQEHFAVNFEFTDVLGMRMRATCIRYKFD